MEYSFDNTAYLINDSNCERLNQIYLKYWKPNGYCFGSGRTASDAYHQVKDILNDGPIIKINAYILVTQMPNCMNTIQ